jgi:uncharacterized protein YqgC (DUF456 family)
MEVIEVFFIIICVFSIVANFLSIPGNFVLFLNTAWYGAVTNFTEFSFTFLLTIFAIAVGVELLEYFIIAFGARKYGASRWGVVGAILGGIGGSISGFFFSPIVGAVVGGFIGVTIGTISIELLRGKNIHQASYAALGALLGRVGGLSVKAIGSVTMVVIIAHKLFL